MPASLRSFIEAASDSVARAIAAIHRDAVREKELRDAEYRARLAELDARILAVSDLERRVAERLATLKDGDPGASVMLADVQPIVVAEVCRLVSELPAPKDGEPGRSVAVEDVVPLISAEVVKAVAALPAAEPGMPGESIDPAEVERMISDSVMRAVAEIPPPKDGVGVADAAIEEGSLVISLTDGTKRDLGRVVGADGKAGMLPLVVKWEDRVFYAADVVTREGASFQALRDTGRAPPHDDWICIAGRGKDGENGRSLNVRGTWDEKESSYRALDIVALEGASFIARRDNPGVCPGEGWQIIAMQGKRGKPGEPGKVGVGLRGLPGATVVAAEIDDEGMLTLTNGDGSKVACDLYPLLAKLQ